MKHRLERMAQRIRAVIIRRRKQAIAQTSHAFRIWMPRPRSVRGGTPFCQSPPARCIPTRRAIHVREYGNNTASSHVEQSAARSTSACISHKLRTRIRGLYRTAMHIKVSCTRQPGQTAATFEPNLIEPNLLIFVLFQFILRSNWFNQWYLYI